jgi:hypothetical protein
LQVAKHELDEVIELGEVDLPGFLAKFRETDWEFEADRLQFLQKTSPNNSPAAVPEVPTWTSALDPALSF